MNELFKEFLKQKLLFKDYAPKLNKEMFLENVVALESKINDGVSVPYDVFLKEAYNIGSQEYATGRRLEKENITNIFVWAKNFEQAKIDSQSYSINNDKRKVYIVVPFELKNVYYSENDLLIKNIKNKNKELIKSDISFNINDFYKNEVIIECECFYLVDPTFLNIDNIYHMTYDDLFELIFGSNKFQYLKIEKYDIPEYISAKYLIKGKDFLKKLHLYILKDENKDCLCINENFIEAKYIKLGKLEFLDNGYLFYIRTLENIFILNKIIPEEKIITLILENENIDIEQKIIDDFNFFYFNIPLDSNEKPNIKTQLNPIEKNGKIINVDLGSKNKKCEDFIESSNIIKYEY